MEKVRLGDICVLHYGKSLTANKRISGNVPVYSSAGLIGYHNVPLVNNRGIIIGRKGTVGKVYKTDKPFYCIDTAFYILPNDDVYDFDYLYYCLKGLGLENLNEDSAVPGLNRETTYSQLIYFPKIEIQKKIAKILSDIDVKIENNNRINDNLEKQASLIYQGWFEDFILSDGFCPISWKQGILSDIANITSGKRPPLKFDKKTKTAIIPLVGAASVIGYTTEANHTDKILVTGRVGTHGIIQRFNYPCWTSDNTLVITSCFYEYTYQLLKRIDYHSMNHGSTQPLITQSDMNKLPILIPDQKTLKKYEMLVGQLMKQYHINLLQNIKFVELRDTILSKLISGELDISNYDL